MKPKLEALAKDFDSITSLLKAVKKQLDAPSEDMQLTIRLGNVSESQFCSLHCLTDEKDLQFLTNIHARLTEIARELAKEITATLEAA